jgi:8-oxo-dGTP pyrophosphatase MutT (NUDIX family)
MDIFINQTRLVLCSPDRVSAPLGDSNSINLSLNPLKYNQLYNEVVLQNPSEAQTKEIMQLLINHKLEAVHKLTLVSAQFAQLKDSIKKDFRIIDAGGGLVTKNELLLWIFRLGKWDLPKGKRDDNERFKQTAVREVEEECNIKVTLEQKICTTWHYYDTGKMPTLKKTKWYWMQNVDDSTMKPQIEEDILDICWMDEGQSALALQNTYPAIAFVIETFKNNLKSTQNGTV